MWGRITRPPWDLMAFIVASMLWKGGMCSLMKRPMTWPDLVETSSPMITSRGILLSSTYFFVARAPSIVSWSVMAITFRLCLSACSTIFSILAKESMLYLV